MKKKYRPTWTSVDESIVRARRQREDARYEPGPEAIVSYAILRAERLAREARTGRKWDM